VAWSASIALLAGKDLGETVNSGSSVFKMTQDTGTSDEVPIGILWGQFIGSGQLNQIYPFRLFNFARALKHDINYFITIIKFNFFKNSAKAVVNFCWGMSLALMKIPFCNMILIFNQHVMNNNNSP